MKRSWLGIIAVLVVAVGCGAAVDKATAKQTAERAGFTDVQVLDKSVVAPQWQNGCGEGDAAGFAMQGKNPAGYVVNFSVCCGWPFKSCTIRY